MVGECANPKCISGPDRTPAKVDFEGRVNYKGEPWPEHWPVTTLADDSKVLKYCSLACWRSYQQAQAKMPEAQRDPDVGELLCTRCGGEIPEGAGSQRCQAERRGQFCSVACVAPLANVYKAAKEARAGIPNRSRNAVRRNLPEPADPVDMAAAYRKQEREVMLDGRGMFWDLLVAPLETVFEWRVELECGCVRQGWTKGDNPDALLDGSDDHFYPRVSLPAGQRRCFTCPHAQQFGPVRNVVRWVERSKKLVTTEPLIVDGKEIHDEKTYASLACGAAVRSSGHRF